MKKIALIFLICFFFSSQVQAMTCMDNSEQFFDTCICNTGYVQEGDKCISEKIELENSINYKNEKIKIDNKEIEVEIAKINLNEVDIITDTAEPKDCKNNCKAKSLKDYVDYYKADLGINGSYFCPKDYKTCSNKINNYFYPVYNSNKKILINEKEIKWLKWGVGILAFNKDGEYKTQENAIDSNVRSLKDFETKNKFEVSSLISSEPVLISNGYNKIKNYTLDNSQKIKTLRSGIGVKNNILYLIVAKKSNISDLAKIFEYYKVDFALNLDGGGSSALYYEDKYIVGPGRNIPNAIIIKTKNNY